MRTREEIWKQAITENDGATVAGIEIVVESSILEVLLDIRDLLSKDTGE